MKLIPSCTALVLLLLLTECTSREPIFSNSAQDPTTMPAVLSYDPSPLIAAAPEQTSIGLLFSVPMNPETVLEAFSVQQDGLPLDVNAGSVEWESGFRLLLWTPSVNFTDGGTVSGFLSATAQSASGMHLIESVGWSFPVQFKSNPGTPISISVTSPGLGDTVPLDQKIYFHFDRPMLRSTVESSFVLMSSDSQDIRTVADGDFTWEYVDDSNILAVFTPRKNLWYDKTYTVFVNQNGALCRDLWNNTYAGAFSHSFFSVSP